MAGQIFKDYCPGLDIAYKRSWEDDVCPQWVSEAETKRIVNFWGNQRRPEAAPIKFEDMRQLVSAEKGGEDSMLGDARQLAQEHKCICTSFLQRRLRIGYLRAARIMEKLEEEGFGREPGEQPPRN